MSLATDLSHALEREELHVQYQVQVDVESRDIVGVEALCRWEHPQLGDVGPEIFIPLAESTGLINAIGAFMIENSCRLAAELHGRGIDIGVAVNVSAHELATTDVYAAVAAHVVDLRLGEDWLTLEVTESVEIEDIPLVAARLGALRDIGVSVSIDDFGTGYSSIPQALALPGNELKIDRSLVVAAEDVGSSIVVGIVALAHRHGMRVVAEGVETEEQLALVTAAGCDRAQGFLFSRPMSRDALDVALINLTRGVE